MFGAIVVTLVVSAIVGSYMAIVNRMLRSDEHWSESSQITPAPKATVSAYACVTATPAHA